MNALSIFRMSTGMRELVQGRLTSAEVVDRDAHAQGLERLQA